MGKKKPRASGVFSRVAVTRSWRLRNRARRRFHERCDADLKSRPDRLKTRRDEHELIFRKRDLRIGDFRCGERDGAVLLLILEEETARRIAADRPNALRRPKIAGVGPISNPGWGLVLEDQSSAMIGHGGSLSIFVRARRSFRLGGRIPKHIVQRIAHEVYYGDVVGGRPRRPPLNVESARVLRRRSGLIRNVRTDIKRVASVRGNSYGHTRGKIIQQVAKIE